MTEQRPDDAYPQANTGQTEHERRVAEIERERGTADEDDATVDEGRRPTSDDDLAADRTGGDR